MANWLVDLLLQLVVLLAFLWDTVDRGSYQKDQSNTSYDDTDNSACWKATITVVTIVGNVGKFDTGLSIFICLERNLPFQIVEGCRERAHERGTKYVVLRFIDMDLAAIL